MNDVNDNEPQSNTDYAKEDYDHIFKGIPVLFEHLFMVLEDRPQVLERKDALAFNDISHIDSANDGKFKRDIDNDSPQKLNSLDVEYIESEIRGNSYEHNSLKAFVADEKDVKSSDNDDSTIDPEEVEKKALMVEQKLEEHNDD